MIGLKGQGKGAGQARGEGEGIGRTVVDLAPGTTGSRILKWGRERKCFG